MLLRIYFNNTNYEEKEKFETTVSHQAKTPRQWKKGL